MKSQKIKPISMVLPEKQNFLKRSGKIIRHMFPSRVQTQKETSTEQPGAAKTTRCQQECQTVAAVPMNQKTQNPRPSRIPIRCKIQPSKNLDQQHSVSPVDSTSPDKFLQPSKCPIGNLESEGFQFQQDDHTLTSSKKTSEDNNYRPNRMVKTAYGSRIPVYRWDRLECYAKGSRSLVPEQRPKELEQVLVSGSASPQVADNNDDDATLHQATDSGVQDTSVPSAGTRKLLRNDTYIVLPRKEPTDIIDVPPPPNFA